MENIIHHKKNKLHFLLIPMLSLCACLYFSSCGGKKTSIITQVRTHWAKTYGELNDDSAYSIQQTVDGGYIVAGYTESFGHGSFDLWILKLKADGSVAWQKAYGDILKEYSFSIEQTSDGGYIIAGWSDSFGDSDFLIIKLTSYGLIEWANNYGGINDDHAFSIQQTNDGGYIILGNSYSFYAGYDDIWLIKINSDGSIAWQKTYGGTNSDYSQSFQQTSDGGYILAGGTTSFGVGNWDFWVLKTNSEGIISWQKTYGSSKDDFPRSIQQTLDGGYIIAGHTNSFGGGGTDAWIIKLNLDGSIAWQKTYGSWNNEGIYCIRQIKDGSYIAVGWTYSFGVGLADIFVIKFNSNGSIVWQKTYGGIKGDYANSVQPTSDGGYIIAGETSSFGAGNSDLWILKLNSDGTCPPLDKNISIFPEDTNIVPQDTNVIPVDTNIFPFDAYVVTVDTNATIMQQAP